MAVQFTPGTEPPTLTGNHVTIDTSQTRAITIDPTGPRELPSLRAAMLNAWEPRTGLFAKAVAAEGSSGPFSRTRDGWERETLTDAHLLWVSDDLAAVTADVRSTVPADATLLREDVPWPSGMVVFQTPMIGTQAIGDEAGEPMIVNAVTWGPVMLRPIHEHGIPARAGIGISSYSLTDMTAGLGSNALRAAAGFMAGLLDSEAVFASPGDTVVMTGKVWITLGRSDWCWGDRVDDHLPITTEQQRVSFEEDRRLLFTLWRLMEQTEIVESHEVTRSKKAARKARPGRRDQPVTVLHLRRTRSDGGQPVEGSGRRITVRHMVRPHWAWQAYGPGRSLRKRILRAGHWRGPEDGPVKVTERVWSLDR